MAIRHLNDYINNNNIEQSPNTESYIVREEIGSTVSGEVTAVPNETDSTDAENVEFIDAQSDFNSSNGSVQMECSSLNSYTTTDNESESPTLVIGHQSWHSSVPPDWVGPLLLC